VKNVGPSTAMAILSGGAEPRMIAELIAKEDTAGLTKIKGVGKKTAELLVVELREKCELLLLSWNAAGVPRAVGLPARARGATRCSTRSRRRWSAWAGSPSRPRPRSAELAVGPGITLETLVRAALRNMPR
jgi:Holliday junction DNA helicase RuvA